MKSRNLWMSATLMCALFAIAFTFDNKGIHWIWASAWQGALVLSVAAMVFATLWIRASKRLKMN
jgi:hypothetical protein